jgi:DNA repair exonuclease SbcCD ATPase subunit
MAVEAQTDRTRDMARQKLKTSQRFSRAARAERDRLDRQRSQLYKRREALQVKVDAIDEELEGVDQQLQVLEQLAESGRDAIEIREVGQAPSSGVEVLSGADIRRVAVPLLLHRHGVSPIHYRDWYALLGQEGYVVAGKRPDAVFLNQVNRSPLVWASTQSGNYYLDPSIVEKLRELLAQQQAELSELLSSVPTDSRSLEAHRQRQRQLNKAINGTERDLREAVLAIETAEKDEAEPVEPPHIRVISSSEIEAA